MALSMLHDHTQRHHNTHDRQPYHQWNLDPASKRPQIHTLDHAGTGFGHIRYMSTLSLMSVTHVPLQGQGIVVLDTDWSVQVTLYLHKLVIETLVNYKRIKR